jgi:hypothetical protein
MGYTGITSHLHRRVQHLRRGALLSLSTTSLRESTSVHSSQLLSFGSREPRLNSKVNTIRRAWQSIFNGTGAMPQRTAGSSSGLPLLTNSPPPPPHPKNPESVSFRTRPRLGSHPSLAPRASDGAARIQPTGQPLPRACQMHTGRKKNGT